jgi:hypothetical protein
MGRVEGDKRYTLIILGGFIAFRPMKTKSSGQMSLSIFFIILPDSSKIDRTHEKAYC